MFFNVNDQETLESLETGALAIHLNSHTDETEVLI